MKDTTRKSIQKNANKIVARRTKKKDSLWFDKRVVVSHYAGTFTRLLCLLFSIPFGIMIAYKIPILQYVPQPYTDKVIQMVGMLFALGFEVFRYYMVTKAWSSIVKDRMDEEDMPRLFYYFPLPYLSLSFWVLTSAFIGFEGMRYSSEYLFDSTPKLMVDWDSKIKNKGIEYDSLINAKKQEAKAFFNTHSYRGKLGVTKVKVQHAKMLADASKLESNKLIAIQNLVNDKNLETSRNIDRQVKEGKYTAYVSLFVEGLGLAMEMLLVSVILARYKFNDNPASIRESINEPINRLNPLSGLMGNDIPIPSPMMGEMGDSMGFKIPEKEPKKSSDLCLLCGNDISDKNPNAKFCTSRCKTKYNYEKNKPKR